MTRKARAAHGATCAAPPVPHTLRKGSVPLTAPWDGCGPPGSAQPHSLAAESGELVRTSSPWAGQEPARGPTAIKSGCIKQGRPHAFSEPRPGCCTGERNPS